MHTGSVATATGIVGVGGGIIGAALLPSCAISFVVPVIGWGYSAFCT